MSKVDIAKESLKVGNALASVKLDQMIFNMAKGIAMGQFELDKTGVDITKMMGVPGAVHIGDEQLSMLEAGFIPSFYHFVDTILELKMEVNIREEESDVEKVKTSISNENESKFGAEVTAEGSVSGFFASASFSASASYSNRSKSAYSRVVDTTHAQKFSQDLSASSLMRTKLVPVPAPELLVERIKVLIEKIRDESKKDSNGNTITDEQVIADTMVSSIKEELFQNLVE